MRRCGCQGYHTLAVSQCVSGISKSTTAPAHTHARMNQRHPAAATLPALIPASLPLSLTACSQPARGVCNGLVHVHNEAGLSHGAVSLWGQLHHGVQRDVDAGHALQGPGGEWCRQAGSQWVSALRNQAGAGEPGRWKQGAGAICSTALPSSSAPLQSPTHKLSSQPTTHLQRLVHKISVKGPQHRLVAHDAHTLLLTLHLCTAGTAGREGRRACRLAPLTLLEQ
jgi:hypothetical protein